ncbi:hypothetical protein DFS33DRAFT_504950 [Desarmillaria ectypa]|nr:hypothetical protein DFS33DRAFT_504950 [Desarmillaria ectypa]
MCMTALQSISAKTTPTCRKTIESICPSLCSKTTVMRGKVLGFSVLPLTAKVMAGDYLMGTFVDEDGTSLLQMYKEFPVIATIRPSTEQGKFILRTVPEWQVSSPDSTQFLIASRDDNQLILIKPPEMQRLGGCSKEKLFVLGLKLLEDRNYLSRVAIEHRDEEVKYRRQKQSVYAASRRTVQSNIRKFRQGIAVKSRILFLLPTPLTNVQALRLNNPTNSGLACFYLCFLNPTSMIFTIGSCPLYPWYVAEKEVGTLSIAT